MKTIREVLEHNTQDLKKEYISQIKIWAEKEYYRSIKYGSWDEKQWCEYFGLTPKIHNPGQSNQWVGFPEGFYNTRKAGVMRRMTDTSRRLIKIGIGGFIEREIKKANIHYVNSLEKLQERLMKKGIDKNEGSNLVIEAAKIDVNFTMTIKIKNIKIRAWTIIASGPVQRPHYRYLVK